MKKSVVISASFAMGLSVTGFASPVTAQQPAEGVVVARGYDNCTALNRDFRHGISDRHMTKHQWIRKGATGKGAYKPNLYDRVHSNLDRDDDHIACER